MKKALSIIWYYWEKIGFAIGNFITAIIMTIFYFTLFALFAIPFKIITSPLKRKSEFSNFVTKKKNLSILKDFESEY